MRARGQKTREGAASAVRNRHDRRHRGQLRETHELFDADKRPGEKCGLASTSGVSVGLGCGREGERGGLAQRRRGGSHTVQESGQAGVGPRNLPGRSEFLPAASRAVAGFRVREAEPYRERRVVAPCRDSPRSRSNARVKRGEKPGFPRFRSRRRAVRSFETDAFRVHRQGSWQAVTIKGIGRFRFRGEVDGAAKVLRIVRSPRREGQGTDAIACSGRLS